jgi:hypothetical protein
MNENGQVPQPPDLRFFEENQRKYPPEQLLPYAGLFVAWSPDGTRILASGEDRATLKKNLQAAGIQSSQVVFDFVDPPDLVML